MRLPLALQNLLWNPLMFCTPCSRTYWCSTYASSEPNGFLPALELTNLLHNPFQNLQMFNLPHSRIHTPPAFPAPEPTPKLASVALPAPQPASPAPDSALELANTLLSPLRNSNPLSSIPEPTLELTAMLAPALQNLLWNLLLSALLQKLLQTPQRFCLPHSRNHNCSVFLLQSQQEFCITYCRAHSGTGTCSAFPAPDCDLEPTNALPSLLQNVQPFSFLALEPSGILPAPGNSLPWRGSLWHLTLTGTRQREEG